MLRPAFDESGPLSPSIAAVLSGGTPWQTRVGATIGDGRAIGFVAFAQGLAGVAVVATGTGVGVGIAAALVCACANAYLHARRQIGSSGAEQLTLIVLVTFCLVLLAGGGEQARRIGDWFIGAQVILAYFASGVSKLASPTWRRGEAMRGILSTEGYGVPALSRALTIYPRADVFLCWSVIVWETLFPLVLLGPRSLVIGMLALGVLFHASCAVLMGLNRFPWAFCGCYTAVWVTAATTRGLFAWH